MKALRILLFCGIVMIFTSCQLGGRGYNGPVRYGVALSFQDTEGNDLVEGIKYIERNKHVDYDLYTLEISPDSRSSGWYNGAIYADPEGYLKLFHSSFESGWGPSGYYYLTSGIIAPQKHNPEKITFTLFCPYVFGDNVKHEIVTHWKKENKSDLGGKCYRIEVDGKEITDFYYDGFQTIATITLDRP